ncbi:MAG TPA: trypsin-like peptidase domain-containing protein, partial [Acidobacteriota bacterium]|nr:trypsin-like peptidase domain-containing protein [Acidobacteriota bacterium]
MNRSVAFTVIPIGVVALLVGGLVIGRWLMPAPGVSPGGDATSPPDGQSAATAVQVPLPLREAERSGRVGFADVAERVTPAVVNISSERIVTTQRRVPTPFGWDPFFEFFGRRRYSVPQHRRETSLGSGVIVSADGVILTANHVVEGAQGVAVTLADGSQIPATILGTDPATDVAVLKVDAHDLPVVTLGDSDSARIGDVVLAFGNPFGIGQTVTMGIVSATGR